MIGTTVPPWSGPAGWDQALTEIRRLCRSVTIEQQKAIQLVSDMVAMYRQLDRSMDALCQITCVSCSEVCCKRATVWYDFRDLLFLEMCGETLPPGQLQRKSDGCCSCLGVRGCTLKRRVRPFICTWYICPAQKMLMQGGGAPAQSLSATACIQALKDTRKSLEKLLVQGDLHPGHAVSE